VNPVAIRELQERWRTLRSPILLSIWVLAAGALTFLAYITARSASQSQLNNFGFTGLSSIFASASMGRFILHALLLGLVIAVVFVVPGQSGVTIVGERERQTLQLLQVSQLSAWRIVVGKLMSSLAYVLLLLVATTPLLVIPVLLGGVTLGNVAMGMLMVVAVAVMIGAVSIWVSARARSVQGAVLGSYIWTVGIVFGTLFLLVAEFFLLAPDDLGPTRFENGVPRDGGRELYSALVNPFVGLVDASSNPIEFRAEAVTSPYLPFRAVLVKRQGFAASQLSDLTNPFGGLSGGVAIDDAGFGRGFQPVPLPIPGGGGVGSITTRTPERIRMRAWPITLGFELLVTAGALILATRHVKVPRTRIRSVRRRRSQDAA
jgi:ABC-2 type transport system permease protein